MIYPNCPTEHIIRQTPSALVFCIIVITSRKNFVWKEFSHECLPEEEDRDEEIPLHRGYFVLLFCLFRIIFNTLCFGVVRYYAFVDNCKGWKSMVHRLAAHHDSH